MINEPLIILRLLLSIIFGGLVGFERELCGRTAGLRTHMMVCLGSCLIMLTSMYVFDIYRTFVAVDPGRIAAGVITGIGFLGAGTIMRSEGGGIRGLTTASSLWVVAAIGMAVGIGFYTAAITTTALALIVLLVVGHFETHILTSKKRTTGGE